jgi:DNA end-binding protein Ku
MPPVGCSVVVVPVVVAPDGDVPVVVTVTGVVEVDVVAVVVPVVVVPDGIVVVGTGVVSEALSESPHPATRRAAVRQQAVRRGRIAGQGSGPARREIRRPRVGRGPAMGNTALPMPRAIWTGTISFGLVTVPVKLYAAVQSKTVRFNQLDGENLARIQQKRVNAQTGEEVPYERLVKGYEISPDRYVVIEPRELEAIEPKKTKTIDIEDFVDLEDIDPIFYDHPYYLVPGTGGAKPYRLLVDAMRETNKVGIARVVIRSKEQLVALRPIGEVLGMTTLNFADEIVDAEQLDEVPASEDVKTTKRELDIAKQLVDSLAGEWDPARYHDTYREQVLEMVERKAAGEEIAVAAAPDEEVEPAPDLMAALKASLDAVRAGGNGNGDGAPAPAKKKAPAKKPAARKPGTARKPAKAKAGAKK